MNNLLFLYLEDYQDFEPISINFSNKFKISFDQGNLSIKKTPNLIEGLYGDNIIDMNIIAGENGIGKSTLLKMIADITRDRDRYYDNYEYRYIQVIQTEKNHIKIYSKLDDDRPHNVFCEGLEIDIEHDSTDEPGRPIVYFSPHLDFNLLDVYSKEDGHPIIDLSHTQIMMEDIEDIENKPDVSDNKIDSSSIMRHKINNIQRHLKFIKSYSEKFELPFRLPDRFSIHFRRIHPDKDDISPLDYQLFDILQVLCARYFRGYKSNKLTKIQMAQMMFLRNLLSFYFRCINKIKSQSILNHKFSHVSNDDLLELEDNKAQELIELILNFFKGQDIFKVDFFDKLIEVAFNAISSGNVSFSSGNNVLSIDLKLNDPILQKLVQFVDLTSEQDSDLRYIAANLSYFINFDWSNMSSGEKVFLDLFSRLESIKTKLKKTKETVLMIIDEGEMGFHPSWQIKYIDTLKTFFNIILKKNDFQILLATHSPLVLSDFPQQRVHLLKRNENTGRREKLNSLGSFGQSTSELLANEFFIETTLVGNLAKLYIDNTLNKISSLRKGILPKEYAMLHEKIDLIDEPLIKQLLLNELERKANG